MSLRPKTVFPGEFPGDLRLVLHRLSQQNQKGYVVGPAVRDAILSGHMDKVQRFDLIVLAPSVAAVEATLDSAAATTLFITRPQRLRRNSVAFQVKDSEDGEVIRRLVINVVPSESDFTSELAKREVTVNALAMDAEGGIVDPFGGLPHLEAQVVRPILAPSAVFVQKPVFLMKVAKHLAYHGFAVDEETELHAARNAVSILDVPMERVRPELERTLVNRYPDRGLDFLQRVGILQYILPEVQQLVGFETSCEVHHKDIWNHTKKVVAQARPSAAIRWAALFHDVGKAQTRTVDEQRRVHFFRHEDMSALLFVGIAARLGLEERLARRVHYLIANHSRINMYARDWTDSAVRRMMRDTGEYLDDLMALSRADITSRQERRVEELTRLLDELSERIHRLTAEAEKKPLLPKGSGLIIMEHFGLPGGPVVGQLKKAVEEAIEDGRLPPDQPVESYLGFLQDLIRSQQS